MYQMLEMRPATTIDEVLARLDALVEGARREGRRFGFFACLYREVTRRVKEGIETGRFENPARMERLDVIFANRYLAAADAYRRGRRLSRSWGAAFEATQLRRLLVLQHLVLGINAHINYDLGIAAAQTAPGRELAALKRDFDEIGRLLGEILDEVQARLSRVSPWLGVLDRLGCRTDEEVFTFCLSGSRDLAWRTAERFAALGPERVPIELAHLDHMVAALAYPICNPGLHLQPALLVIRSREPVEVGLVIEALA